MISPTPNSYSQLWFESFQAGIPEERTEREVDFVCACAPFLDLWNPEFFSAHPGKRDFETPAGLVHETRRVEGGRLFVNLSYPDGSDEDFDWQLFTSAEMQLMAESVGLHLAIACTDFNAATIRSPENPRIQFVLQK
jgi:hypothetical protein